MAAVDMSLPSYAENGMVGWYRGDNPTITRALTAFTAIAWYNAIELIILIFLFFKKYNGLYFWTLLVTSISIIPYALGAWIKQVRLTDIPYLGVSFSTVSWIVMVTGQSLVLYSRLHLITQNEKLLRSVLWLIIINSFLLCIPTAVLTFGSQSAERLEFVYGYEVMEKIQMTLFTTQEVFLSGIYLWEARKILDVVYEGSTRKLMWELASINIAIISMDIALLSVEYLNLYEVQTTLKGMIYSMKLKLEFGVLSQLVRVLTNNADPTHFGSFARATAQLGMPVDETAQKKKSISAGLINMPNIGWWSDTSGPPSKMGSLSKASGEEPAATPANAIATNAISTQNGRTGMASIENLYPGKLC